MTTVTGKHKEILIELLIHYLTKRKLFCDFIPDEINNIKEQNRSGQWYINYYINNYGN
jgi:hypothetical protein